jgi:oxygen-independent coproporphyrinogen-3 oxidase
MLKEIQIKSIGYNDIIETIYFGGGTPSFLETFEINKLIESVFKNFKTSLNPEITLEANPDDLNELKLKELSNSVVNRLSIGIQSFVDKDLKLMNRSHSSKDSKKCIKIAVKYFDNISIDLIYGMPDSDLKSWKYNLDLAINWDLNHISAYALTIEPNTVLDKFVKKNIIKPLDEDLVFEQYRFMNERMSNNQYVNYELSSFAKQGYFSKNNTAYWLRKKYIGIGPSAHSFNGVSRSWNVSNNSLYIKAIKSGQMFLEKENLSEIDQYNEYIMTGLRTIWGVSVHYLEEKFGSNYRKHFKNKSQKFIDSNHLTLTDDVVKTTIKGKFLADGIASELFLINL